MALKKQKIILIIEDEEVLQRALYLMFHEAGYTIASSTDGETGLKMAQRLNPDVILLDLILPKMSGFEFLKDIKSMSPLKDIPIVVLSNLGDESDKEKAATLGAADYFVKADTDLSLLKDKISTLLKNTDEKTMA
ncbi:MAG: response regulator [Candidatus Uhrbacteria bacterium]|nr:response regulator [Candidatus Uhrbacteria bacterium]